MTNNGTVIEKTESLVMVAPDYDPLSRYAFKPTQMESGLFAQLVAGDRVTYEYHTPQSNGLMVLTGKSPAS